MLDNLLRVGEASWVIIDIDEIVDKTTVQGRSAA